MSLSERQPFFPKGQDLQGYGEEGENVEEKTKTEIRE